MQRPGTTIPNMKKTQTILKINPFKTDKTAKNGNLVQYLKWKPQAKCQ